MTWHIWAVYLSAVLAVKWLAAIRGELAAASVLGIGVAVVLGIAYFRSAQRELTEQAFLRADSKERAAQLAALPVSQAAELRFKTQWFADVDVSTAPAAHQFEYPPASQAILNVLFWSCIVFATVALTPLLRQQVTDHPSARTLLVVALVFVLGAAGYRVVHRRAGTLLRLDEAGLTELRADGTSQFMGWPEITALRFREWMGALEYESIAGERIRVGLSLVHFAHFVQATLAHPRLSRRAMVSAAKR